MTKLSSRVTHAALLAVACVTVYSNNFRHELQLDDDHVLATNPSVRSLANIPRYFVDPSTFTSLRSNVDYRPLLQVTYALNYAMGGYDTWWWHLTQIALHFACTLGLYYFCRRILELGSGRKDGDTVAWVPLVAALVFALHPTASGVVNYLSARSSLMTAALLFPALLFYMRDPGSGSRREPWLTATFFALAMFTKVEAVGCVAVFFLIDVWRTANAGGHRRPFFADLGATLNVATLRRLAPTLGVLLVYFVIRARVMAPFPFDVSRRATNVSAFEYFITQTVVWWQYVFNWFAPVRLIADRDNYPVYRSLLQGPVLLAIGGWVVAGVALLGAWKKRPEFLFLAVSALALLSPTSSVAPLAEMLNEHRPYLPLGILSLCWMIPVGTLAVDALRERSRMSIATAVAGGLLMLGLGKLTWERNRVFATHRSYLEDQLAKEPSSRSLTNYGVMLMAQGNNQEALENFSAALKYTPNWHIVHINLAIVNTALGNEPESRKHYDLAVSLDQFSGAALTWRGEHGLQIRRYADAMRDLQQAEPKSLERYRICKDLATAYAGLGDAEKSFNKTWECFGMDSTQTMNDVTVIAKPYFDTKELAAVGLKYFERYDRALPNRWWIHVNLGSLAGMVGDSARAVNERLRGEGLRRFK